MIESNHVASVFKRNLWVANRQIEGLNNEDCLLQPPFRGNCINWILGHLLSNRQKVLELLAQEPVIDQKELIHYEFDSEPVTAESEGVLGFKRLLDLLDEAQQLLSEGLAKVNEEEWDNKGIDEKGTKLWERVEFLSWHETYHVGQLEFLRQLAGTDDKVI